MEKQKPDKPCIRMKELEGADSYCPVHAELVRRSLQINDVEVALCDKCMTELKECVYAEIARDEEIRESGERDAICKVLNKAFPGHCVKLWDDPEFDTTLVRLYDIPDESVLTAREQVRELIRKLEDNNQIREMKYLASIVSHSNTVRYYPEHLCKHEARGYAT